MNLPQRFHDKYEVNPDTGCWEWTAGKTTAGYGQITINSKNNRAHRLSFCAHRGLDLEDITELSILHRCDNPCCVNPNHLFAGTYKDNAIDMARKGRQQSQVLTLQDVQLIKKFLVRHPSRAGAFLSRWFGVTTAMISSIKKGKKWAHA